MINQRAIKMKFNLLCTDLGINTETITAEKLALLQQWFQENLSQDRQFQGDETEQLMQYQTLITTYFDDIEPAIAQDAQLSNPKFAGENGISALTLMGFDRVLAMIKPDSTLLNKSNLYGLTPLHQAALQGHLHTTKELIALGANPGILNKQLQYPLFSALLLPVVHTETTKQNKIAIFKLLRDTEIPLLNHQDKSGNTVLHQMAVHDFETLLDETLKTHPELASIKNNHAQYPIHSAILNNQLGNVILLLQVKKGATFADSNGLVALHYAARCANTVIFNECYRANPDINIRDHQQRTPLMLAAELGHFAIVKKCVALGADAEATDSEGATVLHHAVKSNNLEMVRWLMNHTKIEINAKDHDQQTPLDLSNDLEAMAELLIEHGARTAHATHSK